MITVAHLTDQTSQPGPRPVLLCRCCGETYSANRGDYFWKRTGEPFECCETLLVLAVEERRRFRIVRPRRKKS